MDEQPYIEIGKHRYPVFPFGLKPEPQEPIAHLKQEWTRWRKGKPVSLTMKAELTEHGQAIMQEYLASGQCNFSIGYTVNPRVTTVSRFYRKRPRNTRIQRVQARRKALDLGQDGKCCELRTRRASLALRKAEERWYRDMTARQPHRGDYEHKTTRMRRKEKMRALKWEPLIEENDGFEFGLYDFWYGW